MPVILDPADWAEWLQEPSKRLLRAAPENALQAWPVSKEVNKNSYYGTDTTVPVEFESATPPEPAIIDDAEPRLL